MNRNLCVCPCVRACVSICTIYISICTHALSVSNLVTCAAFSATCCQDKLLVDSNMGMEVSGGGEPSSG